MANANLPTALYNAAPTRRRWLTPRVPRTDESFKERLAVAKIPIFVISVIALWIAFHVARDGPGRALGGLFGLLDEPQYGEQARPTRSGKLADRHLESPAPNEDEPDSPWWSKP